MKKLNLSGKKLLLDKTIIGNLDKSKMKKVIGGIDQDEVFLSIISCHTNHAGSACSGCQTCCSGGGCLVA
ncbi:MAG: class I lanthipeptide [Chitinophagaceae bacterium]